MLLLRGIAVLSAIVVFVSTAHADIIYAVSQVTDQLLIVDPMTGAASAVGRDRV
ncbi:MAG: hypothetical protein R3B91_17460 [Planctomycetaceae bacterium]